MEFIWNLNSSFQIGHPLIVHKVVVYGSVGISTFGVGIVESFGEDKVVVSINGISVPNYDVFRTCHSILRS